MGCAFSTIFPSCSCLSSKQLNFLFDEFIKKNCVIGENEYAPLTTVESAFLCFLNENYKDDYSRINIFDIEYIAIMCKHRGFIMYGRASPDTRHLKGLSVVRF
jgi:hypothetical protein